MILDARTLEVGAIPASDVCIVGSGPAGLALALSLARAPRLRIHVLEAGGARFEEEAQALAAADVVGDAYFPLQETRIRALGGSTMSWGGICTPLDPIVFAQRPWVGGGDWPFPQSALDPYFEEALALCQVTAAAARSADQLSEALGRELGSEPSRAEVASVHFSPPTRFGSVYRRRIASSANLVVYLHAAVVELELAGNGEHLRSLRVRSPGGAEHRVISRCYVLAAGGVENPRLLLASNRVHERGIGNAHGLVGRYFMEHPRARNRFVMRRGDTPLGRLLGRAIAEGRPFLRLSVSPDLQRREELLAAHANLKLGYVCQLTPQWEAVRRIVAATRRPWRDSPFFHEKGGGRTGIRLRDVLAALRRPERSLASLVGGASRHASLRRFLQIDSAVEQAPDSRNRIELLRERDALGVPSVRVHWSLSEVEERTYRRSLEILLDELARLEPGIAAGRIERDAPWPSRVVGTWHHMGTVRMHPDPRLGVVDADCRVHGIENLFVAGSCVFPSAGSSAPTLTVIQLALRLASHISQRVLSESRDELAPVPR
ncbi:MAG: GMC oxidoreductase [Gaiellaceae bacterium]